MACGLLPLPKSRCYTLIARTEFLNGLAEYTPPPVSRPTPKGQSGCPPEIIALSKKRRFTRDQERRRIEGLRVLARIIARHYLENPELYPQPVDAGDGSRESGRESAE